PTLPLPWKPDEENPPREPAEENPPRPMDPPLREPPPCIWAEETATSASAHTAAMAHWCRIQRIIAPLAAAVCQIFSSPCPCHPEPLTRFQRVKRANEQAMRRGGAGREGQRLSW